MVAKGYMDKWLKVDLVEGVLEDFKIDEGTLRKYLGGKWIAAKMLYDKALELEKKGLDLKEMDPYSPENLMTFATGPVTATKSPNSGRHHVMTLKSPLTGGIGSGNTGGRFGAKLKPRE